MKKTFAVLVALSALSSAALAGTSGEFKWSDVRLKTGSAISDQYQGDTRALAVPTVQKSVSDDRAHMLLDPLK